MKKILVVDDDEITLDVVAALLESAGYEVMTAYDGSEVMAKLKEMSPDLLLMDLVMPNQEGIETIVQVRKQYKHIPVIAMSSFNVEYLSIAQSLGANASVMKPIHRNDLLSKIQGLLS